MKRVVLISEHYFESRRRAGFHWLAEAFWQSGWEVIFMTNYVSWLNLIKKNPRLPGPLLRQAAREGGRMKWVRERLASYVWFTPWHPANLGPATLNRLLTPLHRLWGRLPLGEIRRYLPDANLMIFESTPGLVLFERFKRLNPAGRFVYRVSDDLRLLKRHPVILEAEQRFAPQFDLVSTPSEYIYRKFAHLPSAGLHYHGLNKDVFNQPCPDPYAPGATNAVFVGNAHFDHDFLERASRLFPDWHFAIIGPLGTLLQRPNITTYGELPFAETIPYIKYADVGLHTLAYSPGAESFTDSLKVHQYTYCHLPVVAPDFLKTSRRNLFYYTPGSDASIQTALQDSLAFDRVSFSPPEMRSWNDLAEILAGEPLPRGRSGNGIPNR